jgi:hypothetical protein
MVKVPIDSEAPAMKLGLPGFSANGCLWADLVKGYSFGTTHLGEFLIFSVFDSMVYTIPK